MNNNTFEFSPDLLEGATKIVVGVSGGVDSMVLLHIMHRKYPGKFSVLHVDHNINPASGEWASFVKNYCDEHDVECVVESVDITKYGNNVENAARQARYMAFAKQKASHILLAHHADDQCETFFLKLLRGSGLKGLRCMAKTNQSWFDPDVNLVRPLLDVNKEWIRKYAEQQSVPCIEDISNSNVKFDRNWIRHELWPSIMARNAIADINVIRTVGLVSEAWELTQDLAEIDLKTCMGDDNIIDWHKVRTLKPARLKNVILYLLDKNNVTGFSTHHIEEFTKALIRADMDSKAELRVKNFKMRKNGKRVFCELGKTTER